MTKIGTFKIENSFKLTGRGLVALGQIIDGRVKIGSHLTFDIGDKIITMKISGVEMADIDRFAGKFAVALTLVYPNKEKQEEFETLQLKEQLADITEDKI